MAPSIELDRSQINGSKTSLKDPNSALQAPLKYNHDHIIKVFRALIADLCQQFNMGHPGSAMGMAAIGVALWKYIMKYSPRQPEWFNRDRFVLSNGHACLFQYTLLHLTGYNDMNFEQLKSYHSDRYDSLCPGHPEIEHEGIEVTTGPLGQGIANAVGMAMASKQLAATYNKPGHEIVDNHIWCTIGDACLQEGVGMEAVQLAGHWRLNNLTVIYDNNNITCDGSADMVWTEDINAKMRANGWHVLDVYDGVWDVNSIVEACLESRNSSRPTFINIRTIIGVGSKLANDPSSHGAPLGKDNVAELKKGLGLDPDQYYLIPQEVYDFFDHKEQGKKVAAEWQSRLESYQKEHPEAGAEFEKRMKGEPLLDFTEYLPKKEDIPTDDLATRKGSGFVLAPLSEKMKHWLIGTADLTPSVNLGFKNSVDFQDPELRTACGLDGNYSGRYIHWGVREHAMCSVSNGIAAYNRGTFIPFTSSFLMFYIYGAPGVRMGALQKLHIIHIATHDSIGAGEDGPTHQPVELAALYRAMPNVLYIRPCDTEETVGAYTVALSHKEHSSIISLSRHNVKQWPKHSSRDGVLKGAYVFIEDKDADVTLIATGAEMVWAVEARDELAKKNIKARIVSFPCQRLFDKQPKEYRQEVLGTKSKAPVVVIEAYAPHGWERYADASFGMPGFGKSLPGKINYEYFNFSGPYIAGKIEPLVQEVKKDGIESLRGDFRELNGSIE